MSDGASNEDNADPTDVISTEHDRSLVSQ